MSQYTSRSQYVYIILILLYIPLYPNKLGDAIPMFVGDIDDIPPEKIEVSHSLIDVWPQTWDLNLIF